MSEKLCLKWNDFQDNVNTAFGRLREGTEFVDVTLACEDGQQVEAHKVILAASSPFFDNLLKKNRHPHPLIFMKGVKFEEHRGASQVEACAKGVQSRLRGCAMCYGGANR